MSWIQPEPYDYRLFDALDFDSAFGRLCLVVAPALRVEPRLLRNARRRFLPRTDAGLENRLWFSRVVESRSTRSVSLRSGLARLLVDHLGHSDGPQGSERLASICAFITEHTRDWDELDRLEQSLRWAICDHDQPRVGDLLRDLLRRLGVSSEGRERADLARWIKGALPPLQGAIEEHRESSWLAQFAGAALGDTGMVLHGHGTQAGSMPDWLSTLLPAGPGLSLGLRLGRTGDRLILECLAPEPGLPWLDLSTPAPAPVRIECEDQTDRSPGWVSLFVGCRISVALHCRALILQTLDGRRFRLASGGPAEAEVAAPATAERGKVVLVHAPGDEDRARQLAELLERQSVRVRVQPHIPSSESDPEVFSSDPEEQIVGLWSERAAKVFEADPDRLRSNYPAALSTPGYRLLVTLDKTPVPTVLVVTGPQPALVDLSDAPNQWGPEQANKLLTALSSARQGDLRVLRPEGAVESFQPDSIALAIADALRAGRGLRRETEQGMQSRAQALAQQVVEALRRRYPQGGVVDTGEIGDEVQRVLIKAGQHEAARAYAQRRSGRSMEEQGRFDVYLSYAQADQSVARELARRLKGGNLRVFLDTESMVSGSDWRPELEQRRQAARCVLVLWSRAASNSAYVHDDARWALRQDRYFPAVLDDYASIPSEFTRYGAADLKGWPRRKNSQAAFARLLEHVHRFIEEEPSPEPGPGEPSDTQDTEVNRLLAELENPKTLPQRRLGIGDRLAELGDPRPGVGLDNKGLPDIDWVSIPAGSYLYGENKETRELPAFSIARYPVSNAQYQAFIDARGYQEARWWEGLAVRIEKPETSRWPVLNRPRTNVSWFEAVAFCRWLSAQVGYEVRLPTEFEWERAARGTDGREYPWGNGYRSGLANVNERGTNERGTGEGPHDLNQTTAVGIYPQGASPEGVLDMAGNVFEWCLNEYARPERTSQKNNAGRVVRGGCWRVVPVGARAAARSYHGPVARFDFVGFRVVCSSSIDE